MTLNGPDAKGLPCCILCCCVDPVQQVSRLDFPTSFPKLEFYLQGFTFIQLLKFTKTNLEMTSFSLFRRPGGWCSACVAALDSLNSEEVLMNCSETTETTAQLDDIVDFGLARNLDRVGGLRRWKNRHEGCLHLKSYAILDMSFLTR